MFSTCFRIAFQTRKENLAHILASAYALKPLLVPIKEGVNPEVIILRLPPNRFSNSGSCNS